MTKDKLYKLVESLIYESLKTQRDKYGNDKINSIKDIDPSNSYKYIDAIQKFIYNDNINKNDVKKYIDIYNDKLNKNLVDKDNRDINKFKTFDNFKKYVDSIVKVKSHTELKNKKRSIINKQYIDTIHTDHGEYAGTYDIYVPSTMEQSIELQSYNTKWCTQIPDKKDNWFNQYRFVNNITLYYFINKDGYTTTINNHEQNKEYKQVIMFQVSIDKDNKVIDIRDNADKKISESELYELSGIKQSDYKWRSLPDGHYKYINKDNGEKFVINYKNGKLNGEYIIYDDEGNKYIKQNYKDNELDGEYIVYWYNGNIYKKQYYKNGEISDGKYDLHYDNGNIWAEYYYKNGKLNGEYYIYYPNGKIYKECNYKNDKLNDEYIEYWNNGNIKIKQYYKDGKLNGKYIKYYENGNKHIEQYYKDGIEIKGE